MDSTPDIAALSALGAQQRARLASGVTRSLQWRQQRLRSLRALLVEHADELLRALQADLPRPALEAWVSEVAFVRGELDHALSKLPDWMAPRRLPRRLSQPLDRAEVRREPLGRVLVIGPWNYPLQLLAAPAVGALAAGNCVVLKPSEHAPHTGALLARLVAQRFDPGDVTVVQGGVQTASALLAERFDHVFFTGGAAVGRIVMRAAAEHLTPVTLELGGKSPCIIDRTVSLAKAARRIMWGKFFHAGQTCVAPDYVLVPAELREAFLAACQRTLRAFYGPEPKRSPDFARIVNRHHFERVRALLPAEGVVCGGECAVEELYIAPTLIDRPALDSSVMQEEIFGPLLPVLPYRTLDDALEIVRRTPDPLALYVFSNDEGVQERVLGALRFGGACINDTLLHLSHPELPFGGVGDSGMGRYHGRAGFEAMSRATGILRRSLRAELPLRYPPYGGKLAVVKRLV